MLMKLSSLYKLCICTAFLTAQLQCTHVGKMVTGVGPALSTEMLFSSDFPSPYWTTSINLALRGIVWKTPECTHSLVTIALTLCFLVCHACYIFGFLLRHDIHNINGSSNCAFLFSFLDHTEYNQYTKRYCSSNIRTTLHNLSSNSNRVLLTSFSVLSAYKVAINYKRFITYKAICF